MSDPLNDPRFPNRPKSPDFWRMSDAVLVLDAAAEHVETLEETVADLYDPEAAIYMAVQRLARAASGVPTSSETRTVLVAMWMDGFGIGAQFGRLGGHRDQ